MIQHYLWQAWAYGQVIGVLEEDGETLAIMDYNDAFLEYYNAALSYYYPLNYDLLMMLTHIGESQAWYVEGGVADFGYPEGYEFLFCCYYNEEVTDIEAPFDFDIEIPEIVGTVTYANGYDWNAGVEQIYAFASEDAEASISTITGQPAETFAWWYTVILEQNPDGTYEVISADYATNNGAITEGLGEGKIIIMAHETTVNNIDSFAWFGLLMEGDVVAMDIEWAELAAASGALETPAIFEYAEETPVEPDEPTDPEDPEDPEDPTDPEDPEDPEKPADPEKPDKHQHGCLRPVPSVGTSRISGCGQSPADHVLH